MSVMVGDTVKVNVAALDAPGARTTLSEFQVRVIGPLAVDGLQFEGLIVKLTEAPVPVFLMYTVLVMVFPGVIVPQSIEVWARVHALSE